jgi:hypothetical protein
MLNQIIAYENGDLSPAGVLRLFAHLIQSGQAWTLQGHYGRQAEAFIDFGLITPDGQLNTEALDEAGIEMDVESEPMSFFTSNIDLELDRFDSTGKLVGSVTCTEENAVNLYESQFNASTKYGETFTYQIHNSN